VTIFLSGQPTNAHPSQADSGERNLRKVAL